MKIAILTTDNREHFRDYKNPAPYFGTAPEALLQGLTEIGGVEVHVVSCTQHVVPAPEKITDNVWYHNLHVPKIGWLRTGYQGCIRATRKKLREIQPDIVHGQGTERDCALSAVFSGFSNVLTIHGNMAELARRFGARVGSYDWLAARLENFTLPRTAGVFCNSNYTESLVHPRAKRTWLVPNALRREFFEPLASRGDRPCILANVGVITPRKQQVALLEVAQNLYQRGLKFEFHFIGVANPLDPYVATFKRKLKPLEAAGYARWIDKFSTAELIRHFDSAAGLVHFPSEEAFGLTTAEAMARGLKFFGARIGGIKDVAGGVADTELFDVTDWNGLTEAIADWIKQGHPLAPSAAGLMREKYHPAVIARRHLEIYREVLNTCS